MHRIYIERWAALLLSSWFMAPTVEAQVVIDWQAKTLDSYPDIVNSRLNTAVIVNNVNDLLYSYKIILVASPRSFDDASLLFLKNAAAAAAAAAAGAPVAPDNKCATSVQKLNDLVASVSGEIADIFDPTTKKNSKGELQSTPLSTTVDSWKTKVKPGLEQLSAAMESVNTGCQDPVERKNVADPALDRARTLQGQAETRQKQIDGPHQIQQSAVLAPENDYTVTVTEYSNGTKTAEFSQKFSPSSTVFTLSLGALLSKIEQRSYVSAKDAANTAQNRLSVNGTGHLTTLGVALLNYDIPRCSRDEIGLTLSSGLVLSFGNNEVSASPLGWFGGLGFHLYHRLFIAAGAHVGQFADFPPGLATGSVVPANYGNLDGVKRTTGRFAFAVTYQTRKFAGGSTKPAAPKTSGPAPVP